MRPAFARLSGRAQSHPPYPRESLCNRWAGLLQDVYHLVNVLWFGWLRQERFEAGRSQHRGNQIEVKIKVTRFRAGLHSERDPAGL